MALTNQIHIYSVDTSCFNNEEEAKLERHMMRWRKYKEILKAVKNKYDGNDKYKTLYSTVNKTIGEKKDNLKDLLRSNENIRVLNEERVNDKKVISIFVSSLTRILGLKTNELHTDIMVVETYFYESTEQLIKRGFLFKGEKYKYYTSSAGQIRTKKNVFIKETVWNKYEKNLMCGLSVDLINKKGGVNVNKFLAYLALNNSATDQWCDFDITKTIVVDDFETMVNGVVDFIDDKTYEIKRVSKDIPITHTDGCGMVLPSVNQKNFMIRLPWVKGLLTSFDFVDFIKQKNGSPNIVDIYGKSHNIIEEDIQIIFTKSQFKMHKFYDSWDDYIEKFQKYNCQAGICNEEDDKIPYSNINYQMLQTLTDITDNELKVLIKESQNRIDNIATSVNTMLRCFGVSEYNKNKTYLQQALELYPELLSDCYTKEILKQIKKKMVKDYRAGRIELEAKYTFIVPDMYAFCEYLFLGDKNPKGLLKDGEVYCNSFKSSGEVDCLRAPHLYKEHAVRKSIVNDELSHWFKTDALYTSCHDLISKILQFDVDGDKSLVVGDKLFCEIAKRNMKNIVPLYYEMKKADDMVIDINCIYDGLSAAYKGSQIGIISNNITKVWNNEDHINIDVVKLLCMENNFVIDYAKTLYKPTRPKEIDKIIKGYTKQKNPYFFIYAKDKERHNVESINQSTVNKICKSIKNTRLNFNKNKLLLDFNYKMLMSDNYNNTIDTNLTEKYEKLNKTYHFKINMENDNNHNVAYIAKLIRDELSEFGYTKEEITDMLVYYLYKIKNSKYKESLWFCYGDVIVENLKNNMNKDTGACMKCGKRFTKNVPFQIYCDECGVYQPIGTKTITCIDCGKEVEVDAKDNETCRCEEHRKKHKRELKRLEMQRYRARKGNL